MAPVNTADVQKKMLDLENNPKEQVRRLEADLKTILAHKPFCLETEDQALSLFLLGRGYLITGRYEQSLSYLNQALEFFERAQDKLMRFHCLTNLGLVYRESKDFDMALHFFQKTHNLSYEFEDFEYVIASLVNLASAFNVENDQEKAFEYLEKALEFKDKIENSKILGDLYNNYAYTLLEAGQKKEALDYFLSAYTIYRRHYGNQMHTNLIVVIANIGETHLLMGDYEGAKRYLEMALEYGETKSFKPIVMDCHYNLSKLWESQSDFEKALKHYKAYTLVKEAFSNEKNQERIEEIKANSLEAYKRSEEALNTLRNVELKNKTNELEKTLKNLAMISQIGQELTSSMDMDEIYEILRRSIYRLMTVHVFGLALYDESRGKIIYRYFEEQGRPLPLVEINENDESSLASYALLHDTDIFMKNFEAERDFYYSKPTHLTLGNNKKNLSKCIVYCRLISEGKTIGLITMQSYKPYEYTESDYEVIKALASYVSIAISNAQKKNIISEKAKELEFLSYHDPLTELYNRRYYTKVIGDCRCESTLPLGILIGDMNNLKLINDHYGHIVGDLYLTEIAKIMKQCADGELSFRLGGDEFAILVKQATEDQMETLAKTILEACASVKIGEVPLSVSLGYDLKYEMTQNMEIVYSKAESKMYQAKQAFHRAI
jgi:diguanylate cyclase (GGDEF)-like protein